MVVAKSVTITFENYGDGIVSIKTVTIQVAT